MLRRLILMWLFPSCDIDADVDRENIWNVLGKLSHRCNACANFSRGTDDDK